MKNTPLSYLTAWSYERLNILHQAAGCLTVAFVILHASLYSAYFVNAGRASRLLYMEEIFGMVAGVSFFGLFFVGTVIRAWWYELFYYLHIALWMLGIVMTGLHQPELGKGIIFAVIVAAGIWVLDRFIRLSRFLIHSTNNSATLTPLPNGATRVTLKKAPFGAASGKHCFLWIPRIRTTEAHPFTIAAMDPLEFVVSSYDGFTSDLHRYASANPGAVVKASVDGPYGTFPDPSEYDRLFLVAGGTGATFTFGTALNTLKKMGSSDNKSITFIWIVKSEGMVETLELATIAHADPL
jgi:predicted ferric reductase